jgi:hypothetical protein
MPKHLHAGDLVPDVFDGVKADYVFAPLVDVLVLQHRHEFFYVHVLAVAVLRPATPVSWAIWQGQIATHWSVGRVRFLRGRTFIPGGGLPAVVAHFLPLLPLAPRAITFCISKT